MIAQKNFLMDIKKHFRLNIYEVKIWTALLSRGIATAGELADISGVPRSRCYDVLESLEKKGFIIQKIGKPIKYIAVQPEEIISRVKKEIEEESLRQENVIDALKETEVFKELELLHKTGIEHIDPTDISGSFVGRENIHHFLKDMVERAQKSVVIVTTKDGFARKVALLKNTLKNLDKKRVKVKIIAPADSIITKKIKGIAEIKDRETKVRFVNVDNKEVLFMLSDDSVNPNYDSAVWVESEFFAKTLQDLFDGSK